MKRFLLCALRCRADGQKMLPALPHCFSFPHSRIPCGRLSGKDGKGREGTHWSQVLQLSCLERVVIEKKIPARRTKSKKRKTEPHPKCEKIPVDFFHQKKRIPGTLTCSFRLFPVLFLIVRRNDAKIAKRLLNQVITTQAPNRRRLSVLGVLVGSFLLAFLFFRCFSCFKPFVCMCVCVCICVCVCVFAILTRFNTTTPERTSPEVKLSATESDEALHNQLQTGGLHISASFETYSCLAGRFRMEMVEVSRLAGTGVHLANAVWHYGMVARMHGEREQSVH